MQNIAITMCEKFHDNRSRNDRALWNRKSDNNNNNTKNNNKNNVRSAWGTVSGSNNSLSVYAVVRRKSDSGML